jgi:sec-independent protein translocase protein TatA
MPTPGPLELVIILVIALLILGPGKLPEVGSALGKSIREFRKASSDVQEAVKVNVDTTPLPNTLNGQAAPNVTPEPPAAPAPSQAEIDRLRAEMESLRAENQRLASDSAGVTTSTAEPTSSAK